MKRFLALTIFAIMLLCLCGCKNNSDSESAETATQNTSQTTASEFADPDTSVITSNSPTEAIDNMPVIEAETFDENGHALVPDYDPFEDMDN